ncbi:MAG: phosphohydrolase [Lachnospiraceae bacterium]|nr:phosphohydrolase [Lachnospiraceae bacterium]MCM1238878.1 phosphohydrolase [Lachnospiraceae bacterium]
MQFIEMPDLKAGMRLARPIYNKQGVLLYERDSRLNAQVINSVKNFGLLGMYILDPSEPLPPMSEEDLEFERFQTMTVFSLQEEMGRILQTGKQNRLQTIVSTVIKKYGHLKRKINFYQNLRSKDDYVCSHSLNVAMLCAMMTHVMNLRVDEQFLTVEAAILHDMGKERLPKEVLFKQDTEPEDEERIYREQLAALDVLDDFSEGAGVKRICMQALRAQRELTVNGRIDANDKMTMGAKVLIVANRYDEETAMDLTGRAESEVKALQEFYDYPGLYDPKVVDALVRAVNILFAGVTVELSTGDRALVLVENPQDILRPTVLNFRDNAIIDLSLRGNAKIRIVDITKTLDNRHVMDSDVVARMMSTL